MSKSPLFLPSDEAMAVIRRRREEAAKAGSEHVPEAAWERAFEAVILFYEKKGEQPMADLLRLDLDRFVRFGDAEDLAEWVKQDKAG